MSIAKKFEVIADEVYEKGKDYIWEVVQQGGKRRDYGYFAYMWDMEYIHPKYKVVPTEATTGVNTFGKSKIKKIEAKYFDFSQKPRGTASNQSWYYTFFYAQELEEIEDIGMQADYTYSSTYNGCNKLKTIAVIRTDADTAWSGAFSHCSSLENIVIEGVIGKNGFNVKDCKKLTVASLLSILTALSKDSSIASGKSITFSTVHQSVIEGDANCLEQLNLAVAAGWTIAYA